MAERIILALGALACVLVWLGIKPQEVTHMTWPHWIWLILGLALFAISLYSSIRSFRIQAIDLDKSKKENASLKLDIEKLTGELDSVKTDLAAERLLDTPVSLLALSGDAIDEVHAECIRPTPCNLLALEDCLCEDSGENPYRDRVRIILAHHWDRPFEVWAPIWESQEVHARLPLGCCLEIEGPEGWRKNSWANEKHSCLTVDGGVAFRVVIDLYESSGRGVAVRLKEGNTGCLLFPIRLDNKLRYERVEI
jgi:hypothetical protein